MQRGKHRLYVDESGNADLGHSNDPNHRFLSLTGVIVGLDYIRDTMNPQLETLKRDYFASHPDDPVILHRHEMVNKRQPFHALRDIRIEYSFNQELLRRLREWE